MLFSRSAALAAAFLLTFGQAHAQKVDDTPIRIKKDVDCSVHPLDSGGMQFMKCGGELVPLFGHIRGLVAGKPFVCDIAAFPSGYLPTFVEERAQSCKPKRSI